MKSFSSLYKCLFSLICYLSTTYCSMIPYIITWPSPALWKCQFISPAITTTSTRGCPTLERNRRFYIARLGIITCRRSFVAVYTLPKRQSYSKVVQSRAKSCKVMQSRAESCRVVQHNGDLGTFSPRTSAQPLKLTVREHIIKLGIQ